MQYVFSLATGIFWSSIAVLELTSLSTEPFAFSPLRTAFIAAIGVTGIVCATMEYLWHLWFARITAVLTLAFLGLAYFLNLLPDEPLRLPYIIGFVVWIVFAAIAGYEKKPTGIGHLTHSR